MRPCGFSCHSILSSLFNPFYEGSLLGKSRATAKTTSHPPFIDNEVILIQFLYFFLHPLTCFLSNNHNNIPPDLMDWFLWPDDSEDYWATESRYYLFELSHYSDDRLTPMEAIMLSSLDRLHTASESDVTSCWHVGSCVHKSLTKILSVPAQANTNKTLTPELNAQIKFKPEAQHKHGGLRLAVVNPTVPGCSSSQVPHC